MTYLSKKKAHRCRKQFHKATVKVYFYILTCMIDGKVYIGQAIDIERRFNEHKKCSKYKSKNTKIISFIML